MLEADHLDAFIIHNPSGRTSEMQESAVIDINRFTNSFAGRGFSFGSTKFACVESELQEK